MDAKTAITRTVTVENISPQELARLFSEMSDIEQAAFFDAVANESMPWPGLGWCMQSMNISRHMTQQAKDIVIKLAEWISPNE